MVVVMAIMQGYACEAQGALFPGMDRGVDVSMLLQDYGIVGRWIGYPWLGLLGK